MCLWGVFVGGGVCGGRCLWGEVFVCGGRCLSECLWGEVFECVFVGEGV